MYRPNLHIHLVKPSLKINICDYLHQNCKKLHRIVQSTPASTPKAIRQKYQTVLLHPTSFAHSVFKSANLCRNMGKRLKVQRKMVVYK